MPEKVPSSSEQPVSSQTPANNTAVYLPAIVKAKANVAAIYSRSKASAEALFEGEYKPGDPKDITIYTDEPNDSNGGLPALLKRDDIKAVLIVLPILIQPDIVRKCLAAGKHVLCEKPIGKDVKTAVELVNEYERDYRSEGSEGLIFSIAEQMRFDRAVTRGTEMVSSGKVGKLIHIHSRLWWDVKPDNKYHNTEWRKTPQFQGGFVMDAGIHVVALLRFVSGQEITKTVSMTKQVSPHLPPMDTVDAALEYSGGATGSLSMAFSSAKQTSECLFIGENGTVRVEWNRIVGENRVALEDKEGNVVLDEMVDGRGVDEEVSAFLQAVEAGKGEGDPRGSVREALADVAVIESLCSGGGVVEDYISSK